MVVRQTPLRRRLSLALAGLAMAATPALAQTPAAPSTLAEAWLAQLETDNSPLIWSYSVALRQDTAATLPARQGRLLAELDTLMASATIAGNVALAAGLVSWRQALADDAPLTGRTPGRVDLAWLGANLRSNPPLASLTHWGHCQVPGWVEVWGLDGVERRPWRGGLDLTQLVNALPAAAIQNADTVAVIDPLGQIRRLGIAAWNRDNTPLAPGSRLMVQLPSRQGLRSALPFPGTTVESDLINARLPAYLATRLPGDSCRLQGIKDEQRNEP